MADPKDRRSDRSAAFFDLDRTLLSGGSGMVFSEAMRSAGLITRSIPGERMVYGLFSRVGENLPSMMLARQGATMARAARGQRCRPPPRPRPTCSAG